MNQHEDIDLLKAALAFGREKEGFDPSVMESIYQNYLKWGSLSPGQGRAVWNVIKKFRVNINEWKKKFDET